jgi:hypothetical protein
MRGLLRVIVVLLILLAGLLVYLIVRQSRSRVDLLAHEVSADSIAVYQARADSLAIVAESLEVRYERAGALAKPGALRQLTALKDEIASLRIAIDKWRNTRGKYGEGQAFQKCVLLYGRASGICEALEEAEPLPSDSE